MVVLLSTLRRQLQSNAPVLGRKKTLESNLIIKRFGGHGHGHFVIKPSGYTFWKFVDLSHFYTCIAALIFGPIILYTNVFIGEAYLSEIPDGYQPKYWEYYAHPITRAFAYIRGDPQKHYEKYLHHLYFEDWYKKQWETDQKVRTVMKRNKDYKAYYWLPYDARNYREHAKIYDQYYEENLPEIMYNYKFRTDFKDDGDMPPSLPPR